MGLMYDKGNQKLNQNQTYFIKKMNTRELGHEDQLPTNMYDAFLQWDAVIDESRSMIKDENRKFAQYLLDRYFTIDVFDAQSMFFFGSCKIPLYELLRQGKNYMVRAKECEIFNPDTNKYRGYLNVVLCNKAKDPVNKDYDNGVKRSSQPSQKQSKTTRRKVVSRPMNVHEIKDAAQVIR